MEKMSNFPTQAQLVRAICIYNRCHRQFEFLAIYRCHHHAITAKLDIQIGQFLLQEIVFLLELCAVAFNICQALRVIVTLDFQATLFQTQTFKTIIDTTNATFFKDIFLALSLTFSVLPLAMSTDPAAVSTSCDDLLAELNAKRGELFGEPDAVANQLNLLED